MVISSSVYDAYGLETSTATQTDPFGYNAQWGYYLDRDSGLYYCQARFYDPARGRWLNRDPIGFSGGMNLYGYCGQGPVGWTDPSGLFMSSATTPQGAATAGWALAEINGGQAAGVGLALALAASAGSPSLNGIPRDRALDDCKPVPIPLDRVLNRRPKGRQNSKPLFRVVESREDSSLGASGGRASLLSGMHERKQFFTSLEQALAYQQALIGVGWSNGPTRVWRWPNPKGLGRPGPPVDFIPGPTWMVPPYELPGIGNGVPITPWLQ